MKKPFWENLSAQDMLILGFFFENSLMLGRLCRNKLDRVICIQLGLLSDPLNSSRWTVLFTLHYSARLLTPREPCSQIDALFLWVCYRSIKLYWNIHMWVHLAESNWRSGPARTESSAVRTGVSEWLWAGGRARSAAARTGGCRWSAGSLVPELKLIC